MSKINVRESLRNIDADSCCKYDLLTMYDACPLTDEDKADIAKLLFDNEDPEVIYQKLCTYFCDDDVSELTGLADVQNVTPFEAIIDNVKMGLGKKCDQVFYNDVAGQFEFKIGDTTYTFGLSPVEYDADGISVYVDYNYDMPINYTSIKEAAEDILDKCDKKVSLASQSNDDIDDDTMEYTVYDVVEDEGRLCAKCMNESTNSFEDIKLGKVSSDAVNELLNNILNNPNYKLTDECKRKIADNSAPWGIVMSPSFDITASNALMNTEDFGGSVSFGESEQCTFENGDRVTDGERKGTVIDYDSVKVLVDWDYSETDDIEWVSKEDLSFINSLKESAPEEETDIENPEQEFSSAATSINSTKLPAIYSMVNFHAGDVVVDFGGGKFDNAVNYLKDKDVTLLVYDPYNRSAEHNKEVLRILKENGGADAAVNSNVLNVIKEPEAREAVLRNIKKITKSGAPVYITVYEGKGDGAEGPTKSGYQLNRKTADYTDEIGKVFSNVKRKGKLITAMNESINMKENINTDADNIGKGYTAPVMTSLVAKAKELEKRVEEYKDSNDKAVFDRLLPSFKDNILNYKSEVEKDIKDFDEYWKIHKKAMMDDISEADSILKKIGISELSSKVEKLQESYSDDDFIDEMWEAVKDVSGIQDISQGKKPNTYLVTFDSDGSVTARARILLKAFIRANVDIELDSTNGSNVFTFIRPVSEWEFVKGKMIKDSDGFLTSYDWYRNTDSGLNIFMLGYDEADPDYADWETESDTEAEDWFKSYNGFDEDELDEVLHRNKKITIDTDNRKYLDQDGEEYTLSELKKMKNEYHPDMPFEEWLRDALEDGYLFTKDEIDESLNERYSIKDVKEFLDEVGGYTDYDGKVEELMHYFGMTKEQAESAIQDCVTSADDEIEESVSSSGTAEVISKELKNAAYKLFKTPKWGFESDKEIKDYINPFFDVLEDPKTGDIEVQVRAELDYDNLWDLSNALNKVVSKYDKDAYFEAEQPGIITAVISYS